MRLIHDLWASTQKIDEDHDAGSQSFHLSVSCFLMVRLAPLRLATFKFFHISRHQLSSYVCSYASVRFEVLANYRSLQAK